MISSKSLKVVEQSGVASTSVADANVKPPAQSIVLPDEPVVLNQACESVAALNIREVVAYRDLLYLLTWRDIKVRYKQTMMGAAWAIIQPLFMVMIFAVFFGIFMGVPTDGMPYVVFFYCGLLPWTFFANALGTSSMSLISNSHLITKIYFPRILVPAATVFAGLVDLLISSTILIGLTVYYGIALSWNLLMLPVLLLLTLLLALGFGVWLAALTVKYRDIRHALPFVIQLWMFLTPIIYPLSVVPKQWQWALYLNPLTGIIEAIRAAMFGRSFNWYGLSCATLSTLVVCLISIYAFRRIENSFADLI
jgi:lipopolysaccharide transport system permease protein